MISETLLYILKNPRDFKLATDPGGSSFAFESRDFTLLVEFFGPLVVFSVFEDGGSSESYLKALINSDRLHDTLVTAVNMVGGVDEMSPEVKALILP